MEVSSPRGLRDLEGVPPLVVLGPADLVVLGGGDEGVGDDLIVPKGPAHTGHPPLQDLSGAVAAQGGLAPHQGDGDLVVAVEPGHLLGQVRDALHVAAPGGDDHIGGAVGEVVLLGDDVHPLQVLVLVHGGDVGAQQGVHPVRVHADHVGLGDEVQHVDDAVHHLAGAQQLHQLTGAVHGGQGVQGVQALLELGGRLRPHPQRQGALADAGAVEAGGLEDHVGGVRHDLGSSIRP